MMNGEYKNFTVTTDARGVRRISLDVPGRPMNILDHSVMTELEQIVSDLETSSDVRVVVFQSTKESGFLAGADVSVIADIESSGEATRLLENGQLLFQRIEWFPIPTIVAIQGPCLGGGLELALACDYRVARDNRSTKIGLPEIKLGLIPGWGGTQRLPKLIGLTSALPMVLQGKHLSAREALNCGLVDRAISPEDWHEESEKFFDHVLHGHYVLPPRGRRSIPQRLIDGTALGRALVIRTAKKKIQKKADHYPALASALAAISATYQTRVDGYAVERSEFVKLLATPTCRNLLQLFFAREKARNPHTWSPEHARVAHDRPVQKIGIIGAGAMGAGIGQLAGLRGYDVVLKEINEEAVATGRARVEGLVNSLANRKGWSDGRRTAMIEKIGVTCDANELASTDLIIEAVVERMDVKQSVFREIEPLVGEDGMLASNTSSLSVNEMADAVLTPANFAGLHFFNPVHRMELVEVVRGEKTSPKTVARLVAFVRALGKTPVVTKDSPGFLVNRVLFPYLGEAVLMVREGFSTSNIDKECRRFGMPMGPLELLDQVGLDVALHVASSLSDVLSDTEPVIETLREMVDRGELGKKSGSGFYHYENGRRGDPVATVKHVVPDANDDFPGDGLTRIQRRLVYPMLAESVRCLEEGVVSEPWAIDLAMVLGTGFAPHLGGPLHVVDAIGAHRLVGNMRLLKSRRGPRFEPPRRLVELANSGDTFFGASSDATEKPMLPS